MWQYYGNGFLGGIQAWIFRSRIKALVRLVKKVKVQPRMVLDVGCGPMLVSYSLGGNFNCDYVGVDIMSADRLRKCRDAMRNMGTGTFEVLRASAEHLPFKDEIFDFVLSLDVLEHLKNQRKPPQKSAE